jgi:hypothetical protein
MTSLLAAAEVQGTPPGDGTYQPGVCNIGPVEIARRRQVGHVGLAATIATLIGLIALDAPSWMRLVAAVPAMVSASGYLQARMRFCAAFGQRGIFNFGRADYHEVAGVEARAADRRKARQISAWSFAIGLAVGVAAWLLPL